MTTQWQVSAGLASNNALKGVTVKIALQVCPERFDAHLHDGASVHDDIRVYQRCCGVSGATGPRACLRRAQALAGGVVARRGTETFISVPLGCGGPLERRLALVCSDVSSAVTGMGVGRSRRAAPALRRGRDSLSTVCLYG